MNIREAYCTGNRRYKAAQIFKPQGVVLHSIGTPQPKAEVLRNYWQNDGSAYVVHYMVDDAEIIHCMPDNYKCWHVGTPGNDKFIGIEMGEPKQIKYTSGATFTVSDLEAAQAYVKKCYKNAVELIAYLCKKNGWNPSTAVWTHGEITKRGMSKTDHVDPEHLWDGLGMGYNLAKLRKDVAAAMGSASTPKAEDKLYRVRRTWADASSQIGAYQNLDYAKAACAPGYTVFDANGNRVWPEEEFEPYLVRVTAESGLNVRKGPGTSYGVALTLPKGGAYTIVAEKDGWGLLKAYAGNQAGWISLKYTEKIQ